MFGYSNIHLLPCLIIVVVIIIVLVIITIVFTYIPFFRCLASVGVSCSLIANFYAIIGIEWPLCPIRVYTLSPRNHRILTVCNTCLGQDHKTIIQLCQ